MGVWLNQPKEIKKISCLEMEIAIAKHYNPRQNIIVPNVWWGMGLHECDIIVCTKSNYLYEIEIKTSKQDLKKDFEKRHLHQSDKIKHLYYAVPNHLKDFSETIIPENAGLLCVVKYENGHSRIDVIKQAPVKSNYRISEKERNKLLILASMRTWTLKQKLLKYINKLKEK